MPRKKTEHYVNNKELLEAMIVYRGKVAVARENFIKKYDQDPPKSGPWEGKPPITTYLGTLDISLSKFLTPDSLV